MRVAKWFGILGLGVVLVVGLWLLIGKIRDPSGPSISDLTWEEDVTLASGETVRFKRRVRFGQYYSFGIQSMSAQTVQAASLEMLSGDPAFKSWSVPIQPFFIDRDPENGEWVVIAAADSDSVWRANGRPCPPQWAFRLRNGIWYIQPVPKSLLGRQPNLLADLRIRDDAEFSPAEFQAIVSSRKDQQYADRGFRLNPFMTGVGEIYNYSLCKGKDPEFTREFSVKANIEAASFAKIPRLQ